MAVNSKWQFQVSPEKNVAVLFHRKPYETVSIIYLLGKLIPWESHVKYLDVVLDSKLSFRPHITYVRNKSTYVMSRLFPLICKRSKMLLRKKLTLYKTCNRPIMQTPSERADPHSNPRYPLAPAFSTPSQGSSGSRRPNYYRKCPIYRLDSLFNIRTYSPPL